MALDYTTLAPSVVTKVISRINTPGNTLQRFMGFEPGGANTAQDAPDGVRQYTYDIYDNVRSIMQGRQPGAGPGTVARNPVGENTVTIARGYEKMTDLSYERLSNIRAIGDNAGVLDKRGMKYLEAQGKTLKQREVNFREFLAWGVTLGSSQFQRNGDEWIAVLSGGNYTIDYKMPAGNKTQLNMTGSGNRISATWLTAGTDIPGDLDAISSGFQQNVGAPLGFVVTDSVVFNNVMNNTAVKAQAGTANTVYDQWTMTEEKAPDGTPTGLRKAYLKTRPWLPWYITDAGLEVNGTFTKFFDGTRALFGIDLGLGYAKMQEGSELVKDSPWAEPVYRRGSHFWLREWDEAARVELQSITNLVPEVTIPLALASGTVIF